MRLFKSTLFAIMIAIASSDAATAEEVAPSDGAPPRAVVYCYEAERNVVSRVLLGECHGKVVTDSEAAAINQSRDDRLKRAMMRRPPSSSDGLHLLSLGTGFYVDDAGRLLTNNHVIDGCAAVTVRSGSNDQGTSATVVAVDPKLDLALLKSNAEASATAEFASVGSFTLDPFVAVVGFPDQGLPPLEPLATPGMLLQGLANVGGSPHMVLRIDLRHGNSGGPIFDRQGRVIGIVNAKLDSAAYYTATGITMTDIGLGIPQQAVLDFLQRNNANHEETGGGGMFTLQQILTRAQGFVVRTECWK